MKVILILLIILFLLQYSLFHVKQQESLYLIKVLLYYSMSSIHSVFIEFPFPLGALICILIYMHTTVNRKGKRFAIIMGLCTFTFTAIPTYEIIKPLKDFYLYVRTNDIQEIDVYSVNLESQKRLLNTITDQKNVRKAIERIQDSVPMDDPPSFYQPYDNMILLHCKLSSMDTKFYLKKNSNNDEVLYLGKNWIPYRVSGLYDHIFPNSSSTLHKIIITDQNKMGSIISNPYIMKKLWDSLPWLSPSKKPSLEMNHNIQFQGPDSTKIGTLSSDFAILSLDQKYYKIPYHLSKGLYDQYLLNNLQSHSSLDDRQEISPSSKTRIESKDFIFSIEPMFDSPGYGVYKIQKANNNRELILPLENNNVSIELIRDQYLLLYIESDVSVGDILLVRTISPYSRRYIESEKDILEQHFEVSPKNERIAYLIKEEDTTSLKVLYDIFREPRELFHGAITQIKWLTSDQIVFVNQLDQGDRLLLYDIPTAHITYIDTSHSIQLLHSKDNILTFQVYTIKNNIIYSGNYTIDGQMNLKQLN